MHVYTPGVFLCAGTHDTHFFDDAKTHFRLRQSCLGYAGHLGFLSKRRLRSRHRNPSNHPKILRFVRISAEPCPDTAFFRTEVPFYVDVTIVTTLPLLLKENLSLPASVRFAHRIVDCGREDSRLNFLRVTTTSLEEITCCQLLQGSPCFEQDASRVVSAFKRTG